MCRRLAILFVVAFSALTCSGQDLDAIYAAIQDPDTTKLWKVEVNDGNEFVGKIKSVQEGSMNLQTEKFGTISIWMADVKTIKDVKSGEPVVSSRDNSHSTHYLFMPNGFGLKRGEAYYQNVGVLANQFNVGVTNKISVAVGTLPIYLFGSRSYPFWVAPKISLPLGPNTTLGAGLMYLRVFYRGNADKVVGEDARGGIAYLTLTFGNRDRNTSLGLGYGLSGKQVSQQPAFTISNMTRIGPRAYFITENYIFISERDSFGILSAGGRRIINRLGLDFGGFIPISSGPRFLIIPWIGLNVPLGKRH